jgi:anti-sigma B factor antagonist
VASTGTYKNVLNPPLGILISPLERDATMRLQISRRKLQGIEILTLTGDLVRGQGDLDLLTELDRLIAAGTTRVLFNLNYLARMDSVGVGTLLFVLDTLRENGGDLAIVIMRRADVDLLVEADLQTALEIFPSEQDAINSFFPDRELKRYDILEFVESFERRHARCHLVSC